MRSAPILRFAVAVALLAPAYYLLIQYAVGYSAWIIRPVWWVPTFPSRYFGALAWVVTLHSVAVLLAALPVAIACVLIARSRAASLGLCIAVVAAAITIYTWLAPELWSLIWGQHPVMLLVDVMKIIAAVPLLAWLSRRLPSNYRFERP